MNDDRKHLTILEVDKLLSLRADELRVIKAWLVTERAMMKSSCRTVLVSQKR